MSLYDRIVLNQRMYDDIVQFIFKELEELCVIPATFVWVYPYYPMGWRAVVGGFDSETLEDHFYIFDYEYGELNLDIQKNWGFMKNGAPIVK